MKKIAYLVSDLDAPSHTFVRREISALERLGVPVTGYSVRSHSQPVNNRTILGQSPWKYVKAIFSELVSSPLRVFSTWLLALGHRPRGLKHLLWSHFHLFEAIYLANLLRQEGCDHLHNHFANSGATVGLLASHMAEVSWSLTLHGISETDYPANATLPQKLIAADFVVCASRFMMAQAMRLIGSEHWSKFHIVRCGILRDNLPLADLCEHKDGLRLVSVGRLSAEKGYFGLIEALKSLPEGLPKFAVEIVGDGPVREQLIAEIERANLSVDINLLGALPEAETLEVIASCDFLVLPSLMEGLPVVLIEARGLGKPVVATKIAGIPELVDDGENGVLVEPTNWMQLSRAIELMVGNDDERMRMARNASASFPAEFDIDVAAKKLLQLFTDRERKTPHS